MKKTAAILAFLLVLSLLLSACGETAAPAEPAATETTEPAASALDTIMNVGTTQAFTDEAVPQEDIAAILQAGMIAESAINQQPWFFVAITDKALMEELGQASSMPKNGPNMPAPKEGDVPAPPQGGDMPAPPKGAGGAKAGFGDSPLAIVVYMDENSKSPNPNFDCGLAVQNMYLAATALGYGTKIVSSPTRTLNGDDHDAICEKLGVDKSLTGVAVLLIGKQDTSVDGYTGATERAAFAEKTNVITDVKLPKPGENEMPLA